jgi:hypothetical protein
MSSLDISTRTHGAVDLLAQARDCGVGRGYRDGQIEDAVDAAMWFPEYGEIRSRPR